jgi:hypothetical protein
MRENITYGTSTFYPTVDSSFVNAHLSSPRCYGHCASKMSYVDVLSGIGLLLSIARPTAVFFAVRSIVVDSIKRLSGWPITHIGNKIANARDPGPRCGNRNPSTTVICPLRMRGIKASRNHAMPRTVKRMPGKAMSIEALSFDAPAGFGVLVLKFVAGHKSDGAAVTYALKYDITAGSLCGRRQNGQTRKSLSAQVYKSHIHRS